MSACCLVKGAYYYIGGVLGMRLEQLGELVKKNKGGKGRVKLSQREKDKKFLSKVSKDVYDYVSLVTPGEIEKGADLTKRYSKELGYSTGYDYGEMIYALGRLGVILILKTNLEKKRSRSFIYRMITPDDVDEMKEVISQFTKVFNKGGVSDKGMPEVYSMYLSEVEAELEEQIND